MRLVTCLLITLVSVLPAVAAGIQGVGADAPEQALDATEYAREALMAGFTAVRDGKIPGPRMPVAVHAIGATGGLNAVECTLMVKFGVKPIDALKTATSVDAGLLGIANRLGILEAVVAVSGDPAAGIQQTGKVLFVMQDGVVCRRLSREGWVGISN
jgi:imidazolonepropionase-like amidohydrolase